MASTPRREILAFASFAATLAAIVGVAMIADAGWDGDEWVAVGALAAAVQTLVLLGGLVYAAREISTARELSDRDRERVLVDRLSDAAHESALPLIKAYVANLRRLVRALELEQLERHVPTSDSTHRDWIHDEVEESVDELDRAGKAAASAVALIRRRLDEIGAEGRLITYKIDVVIMDFPRWKFRILGEQPTSDALSSAADELEALSSELDRDVRAFIRSVAPVVRVRN